MEQSRMHDYFSFKKTSHKRGRGSPRSLESGKIRKLSAFEESRSTAETDLSDTTLEIIEALSHSPQSFRRLEVDDILTSVPVKDKFSDLLDPQRSLRLPYKYKKLLSIFEEFDLFVHFASSQAVPSTFSNIKAAVDDKQRSNIGYKEIRQILYVYPEAFRLHWTQRDFSKHFELVIATCGESSISHRRTIFRSNLLEITKSYHRAFMEKLPVKPTIDHEKLNTWHSAFNLDSVPEIPLADLPEQPLELTVKPLDATYANTKAEKELALENQETNLRNQDKERNLARGKRLLSLSEVLKDIYFTQHCPSIFLGTLGKKIKSTKKIIGDRSMIEKDVLEICQIFDEWLSAIKTNSGTVVRMNKQIVLTQADAKARICQKYY